jgi:polar amino acid transport system substrate-binding protein
LRLLLLGALCLSAGAAGPAMAQKSVIPAENNRLAVGGPLEMAPYAYLNNEGIYAGFSVDMVRAAGEFLGIDNILFYPSTLDENLKALDKGQLDCIHFVRYDPRLARDFTYAAIYLESPSVIFVLGNRYDLVNQDDLAGKRVAVLKEDPAYERLKGLKNCYLIPVENPTNAFFLMLNGKADAYVGERLTTLYFLGKRGLDEKFKIVGREIASARFGVIVRKDRQDLAQNFERAFKSLDRSGQQDKIFYQWFGEGFHPQAFLSRRIIRWVLIFVGASLLVAMIVLGWNLLLQRELELKAIEVEKAELDSKIAEEKSRFEAIVQSMTEGLMLVDPNGMIAYVNAPGAHYLGRRVEDLLNRPLNVLNVHLLSLIKDPEKLEKKLDYAEMNPTRPAVVEYTMTTLKRSDIRLKFFPVRDRYGEFAGRGILIEDVTHERELERLKSEFVSIASHELRTPMTSILGFSEIMLTQSLPQDLARRYISQIHGEAERLTRILNDMLDISYLESGEGVLEKKPIRIADLANEVLENFRAQIKDRRQVKVQISGQPGMIMADRDKIVQVFWNLLSNADKYSSPGKEILVDVRACDQNNPEWCLCEDEVSQLLPGVEVNVTDFGQGIQEDNLSMIFIPFYRVETAVHTIRGTGLGLAIVKRIIEAHGGRVWARSQVGHHTTFTIILPSRMMPSGN